MPSINTTPGLLTSVNEVGAPDGSLINADNAVIRDKDIIEPRRGFKHVGYTFGSGSTPSKQGFFYQDKLHIHYDTTLSYDTGSAFSNYSGSYTGADESRMRLKYQTFKDNLYFTTTNGVYKIADAGTTPVTAGVPQALGIVNRTTGNIAGLSFSGGGAPAASVVRVGNQTTVFYRHKLGGIFPYTVSSPVGFVAGETVLCTSTDANFAGGATASYVVTSANLNAGSLGLGPDDYNASFVYTDTVTGNASINTALSITYQTQVLLDASGFLADQHQCAYRFVLDLPDNNQQILLGPPSDSFIIKNISDTAGWVTAQSKNVQLKVRLPPNLPTNARLWVYRTEQTPLTVPPSEEFYKCYEYSISAYDLTNRVAIIKDITPDSLLSSPLYTSPTVEGAISANFKPVKAVDIASWANRLWYANTTGNHTFSFRLIGEIPNGTTFLVYVPGSSPEIAEFYQGTTSASAFRYSQYFFVPSSGGTSSSRIAQTSLNLVETINKNSATVQAFYDEDEETGLGFIRLESVNNQSFIFSFLPNTGNARLLVDPILPLSPKPSSIVYSLTGTAVRNGSGVVTTTFSAAHSFVVGDSVVVTGSASLNGTYTVTTAGQLFITWAQAGAAFTDTVTVRYNGSADVNAGVSTSEVVVNRVYFSKLQQGESVPLLNYIDIGTPGKRILRIAPLRERLYVFKEEGIYTVAGEYPFRVDLVDDTAYLIASDSVALAGNQIFCLTNQGVVTVSESGVGIVSRPIEVDLFRWIQDARNGNSLKNIWGVGYNSERIYVLGLPSTGSTAWVTGIHLVYNYLNRSWTTWSRNQTWGALDATKDKLYMGSFNINKVHMERKTSMRHAWDYCDEEYTATILTDGTTSDQKVLLVISSADATASGISAGDMVYCGPAGEPSPLADPPFVLAQVLRVEAGSVYQIICEYVYTGDNSPGAYQTFVGYSGVAGALRIFKKYEVSITYSALTGGNAAILKQFSEWTPMFNVRSFKDATISFQTNAMPQEVTPTSLATSPLFSDGRYSKISMARVAPISKRVVVPRKQQQGTNLTVQFVVNEALAYWRLLGFNYEAQPISPLANRTK